MSERWPALLSRKDAAEYLGMGASTFSNLVASGKVKGVKVHSSAQPKYKRQDLDEFVESLEYGVWVCCATSKRSD